MSQLFKNYEEEFIAGLANITRKIGSVPVQSNQKKQMAFVEIKEDLDELESTIKRMETECNTLDAQIKFEFTRKVRQYKKDFSDLKKKLYKAEEDYAFEKNKEMLLGAQLDQQKSSQREKLIKHGDMLTDTTYKLRDSVRVMHETLDISNGIEMELVGQTEKMKKNKEKLLEIQDDVGSSNRKIKSMMLRVRKNKLVLGGVLGLVLMIGIVMLVVHFKR